MKRPIKFRGRAKGGRTLFGDIRRLNGEWFIFNGDFWYEVDEDSIAQLVGYDKDGREIYEGDELSDIYEGEYIEYVAKLKAYAQSVNPTGVIRFRFNNLTLKEDEDNDTND